MKQKSWDEADVLEAMIARPAMYFGDRSGYLRDLSAFAFGYEAASGFDPETKRPLRSFFPSDFIDYICETIPVSNDEAPAWISRIENDSDGEERAWQRFQELWQDFQATMETKQPNKPSHPTTDKS